MHICTSITMKLIAFTSFNSFYLLLILFCCYDSYNTFKNFRSPRTFSKLYLKDSNNPKAINGKLNFKLNLLTNERIGEDSAAFRIEDQNLKSWGIFLVAVSGVLSVVFYTWIYEGGFHWGDQFKSVMENLANGDSVLAITYMLGVFAIGHSGLASLRPFAEKIVGARPWRYVFALFSLPLAFSCIVYFINHR